MEIAQRDELAALHRVLEQIFNDPGLSRLRARRKPHPAIRDWDLIARLIEDGTIEYNHELDALRRLAFLTLDRLTWFEPTGDQARSSAVTPEAWRQIRSRVVDQDQYADVLAELYVWGFLAKSADVDLVQEDASADLLLGGANNGSVAEVKRIGMGTKPSRIPKVVTKANKQIKATTATGTGLLFILLERSADRASLDDALPSDVEPFADAVVAALRSARFEGIYKVVLSWDEIHLSGSLAEGATIYTYVRRSRAFENTTSRGAINLSAEATSLRLATSRTVTYEPSNEMSTPDGIEGADIAFSGEFLRLNEQTDGVRQAHVREALAKPLAEQAFKDDELTYWFTTRNVSLGTPHTLLVIRFQMEKGEGRPLVLRAYRIYDRTGRTVAARPLDLFIWLLDRFGADIALGGLQGRLFPRVRIHSHASETELITILDHDDYPPGTEIHASGLFNVRQHGPPRIVDASWCFAINETAYITESRAARKPR